MQMYGKFAGFALKIRALFGLVSYYNDPCASFVGKVLCNSVETDCQDGKQGEKEERERVGIGGAKT